MQFVILADELRGTPTSRQLSSYEEPYRYYLAAMIDLGSIAGLHARDHQLAAYCPRCDARRVS